MESENKGYLITVANCGSKEKSEKVYLKPMAFYIPGFAADEIAALSRGLSEAGNDGKGYMLTVTNKNNGVSVDKTFAALAELAEPSTAADAVKELINIVRGYDSDEETNVCGW